MTKTLLIATALVLPLAACRLSVDKDGESGKANVDIKSPIGDVSVRTGIESPDTGLPVYPGARTLSTEHEPGTADVNIGNSFFGVNVVATKFETEEMPDRVVGFYKNEMKAYGDVLECHGNIDFRDKAGLRQPYCRERAFSRETQLVAGVENRHRIVVVKPRGGGAEFSVVYVQTRGNS